jgi:hypothetical protein
MRMNKLITIFLLSSMRFGLGFWLIWGHDLSYDVDSSVNGSSVYWYSEDFSPDGRIIISSAVGCLAGECCVIGTQLVFRKREHLTQHAADPPSKKGAGS